MSRAMHGEHDPATFKLLRTACGNSAVRVLRRQVKLAKFDVLAALRPHATTPGFLRP